MWLLHTNTLRWVMMCQPSNKHIEYLSCFSSFYNRIPSSEAILSTASGLSPVSSRDRRGNKYRVHVQIVNWVRIIFKPSYKWTVSSAHDLAALERTSPVILSERRVTLFLTWVSYDFLINSCIKPEWRIVHLSTAEAREIRTKMEKDLDSWIQQLKQCKQLEETCVKNLCDKVLRTVRVYSIVDTRCCACVWMTSAWQVKHVKVRVTF